MRCVRHSWSLCVWRPRTELFFQCGRRGGSTGGLGIFWGIGSARPGIGAELLTKSGRRERKRRARKVEALGQDEYMCSLEG